MGKSTANNDSKILIPVLAIKNSKNGYLQINNTNAVRDMLTILNRRGKNIFEKLSMCPIIVLYLLSYAFQIIPHGQYWNN